MSVRNKNFIMFPNKAWERLYEIKVQMQERRVFDYIFRQTEGYPDNPRDVSTYNIAKALKLDDANVRRSIRWLVKHQMVVRRGIFKDIQKDFALWGVGHRRPTKYQVKGDLLGRSQSAHSVGHRRPLLKETPKDREKKGVLSNVRDEELVENFNKYYDNITKDIGNFPE